MTTRKYTSLPYTEYPTLAYGSESTRKPIDTIILHSTNSTYESAISWFNSPNAGTSAHYIIANDGRLAAMLEEYFVAYHSGNLQTNERSIGIEHEGYSGLVRRDSEYDTSAKLVADVCKFYSIPCDSAHIKPHREIVATACPTDLDVNRIISSAKLILAGNTPPMNESQQDKQVQFDRRLQFLKSKNFIQSDASEKWTKPIKPDGLLNLEAGLWKDREIDRPKASITDQLRNMAGLPNGTAQQIYDKIKSMGGCSPTELAKVKEQGRQIGRQEIKDVVNKLA